MGAFHYRPRGISTNIIITNVDTMQRNNVIMSQWQTIWCINTFVYVMSALFNVIDSALVTRQSIMWVYPDMQ